MKFKGTFSNGDEFRIGRFYNSDIKKICSMLKYFDNPMPDEEAKDPERYFAIKVANERELFFSVKKGKKVVGYGNLSMLDQTHHMSFNFWKRNVNLSFGDLMKMFRLVKEFGVKIAKARRVTIVSANPRVFALYKRMGFEFEGIMRGAAIYDGEPTDVYIFGMLTEEN